MSALRIAVPGEPIRHIDLGPAAGRIVHTRGAIYGGVMVVAHQPKPTEQQLEGKRAAERKWYAAKRAKVVCGYVMPITGEACARRKDHSPADDHRSRRAMKVIADRRWAK